MPLLETFADRVYSAAKAEPSWIFGLWRAKYLNEIFPDDDFDWLDLYLLQKALQQQKVGYITTESSTKIGTWNTSVKTPYAVKAGKPNPRRILREMICQFPWVLSGGSCAAYIWLRQIVVLLRLTFLLRFRFFVSSRKGK